MTKRLILLALVAAIAVLGFNNQDAYSNEYRSPSVNYIVPQPQQYASQQPANIYIVQPYYSSVDEVIPRQPQQSAAPTHYISKEAADKAESDKLEWY